jgi:hypothetical protein
MKTSARSSKVIGIIGVLFGLGAFTPLFVLSGKELLVADATFFAVRYFKLILSVFVGAYFLVLGILMYIGFLTPWSSADRDEKAKLAVFNGIGSIPYLSLFAIALIVLTKNGRLEIIWLVLFWCGLALLIIFFFRGLFLGIKVLRKRNSRKKGI